MEKKPEPPPSRVSTSAGLVFLVVIVVVAAVIIALIRNTRPSQDTPNGMPQNIEGPPSSGAPPTSPAAP
jgi:hypothetical protein